MDSFSELQEETVQQFVFVIIVV